MTIAIANTANTNTFNYWRTRTNDIAYAMSTYAVTTESNTATGNAAITGTFTASNFRISNGAGTYDIVPLVLSSNIAISGTGSNTIIDSYVMADFAVAEYIVNVKDNTANNYYSTKLLLTHDTGGSFLTEYGIIFTNTNIGYFNSTSNASHVILIYNSTTSTNSTVKFTRNIL